MISISLIGNESLNILIRALTVFTFIKNEKNIKKIIEKDNLFNMTNLEQRSESTNKKFNKLLYEARVNKIWGNKFHLMAISSFLRRNIIILGLC